MKTDKRKRLEMEAMILGVTVTYAGTTPRNAKKGDRLYFTPKKTYYIYTGIPEQWAQIVLGDTGWNSVGSKRFFDLSDIQK